MLRTPHENRGGDPPHPIPELSKVAQKPSRSPGKLPGDLHKHVQKKSEKSVPKHPWKVTGTPFDDPQTSWEHSWNNPEKSQQRRKSDPEVTPR